MTGVTRGLQSPSGVTPWSSVRKWQCADRLEKPLGKTGSSASNGGPGPQSFFPLFQGPKAPPQVLRTSGPSSAATFDFEQPSSVLLEHKLHVQMVADHETACRKEVSWILSHESGRVLVSKLTDKEWSGMAWGHKLGHLPSHGLGLRHGKA